MSAAVSAQYSVVCPTCGAGPRQPCRTLGTMRVTDTHQPRIKRQYGKQTLTAPHQRTFEEAQADRMADRYEASLERGASNV